MKVYRFLATLIAVFFFNSGSQVVAQDLSRDGSSDLVATDYELRASRPCLPFQLTDYPPTFNQTLDDQGHNLPINQCKQQFLSGHTDRCGFSAGHSDRLVVEGQNSKAENEIDLSPMRFDCLESDCEFEYAKSAREFQAAELIQEQDANVLGKEDVRRIIDSVFTRELAIDENVEAQFGENDFDPYVDPTRSLIFDSKIRVAAISSSPAPALPVRFQMAQLAAIKLATHPILLDPIEYVNDQLTELECQLCGTPVLNLAYSLCQSVAQMQVQLTHEKELAKEKKAIAKEMARMEAQALLLKGFAKSLRAMGESMIQVSESISTINRKKVEFIARQSQ